MHADFSVELGSDDPALEIPWSSDGAVRYYDLRKNPEAVAQIPEAAAYPELRAFLVRVNATDSRLETAKCDVWQSREILPEEEIFGAERKFVSYVDLVFVQENERNSFAWHEKFAEELCKLLSRAPDIAATVEVIIRRCYYHQGNDRQGKPDRNGEMRQAADAGVRSSMVHGGTQSTSSDFQTSFSTPSIPDVFPDQTKSDNFPSKPLAVRDIAFDFSNVPAGLSKKNELLSHSNEEVGSADTSAGNYDSSISAFYMTAYTTGFGNNDDESHRRWAIVITLLRHTLIQLSISQRLS
jgi:hypothetical protein